jgi:hypothetical protein
LGEKTSLTELVQSELGFNIIRSQGRYVGCRKTLGTIDFTLPLGTLLKSYPGDLIMATTLEDVLLGICETRIAELKLAKQTVPASELLESHVGYTMIQRGGNVIGWRQSLGKIDFAIPLEILLQGYPVDDFFVEETREKALLRICEIEKARLNRVVAERRRVSPIRESHPIPGMNLPQGSQQSFNQDNS